MRDLRRTLEQRRRTGGRLLVATAIASVLPLVAAFRPDVVPPAVGALAFPAWAALGLFTLGHALADWLWYRRVVDPGDAPRRRPPR